ncbi:hypothetical protein [Caballeronia sp. DA-9]|uniref:hypothetical protein n=1 Tax=Caballeronia sp. DA-9 TaxID=3436237 RepID=UPI003F67F38E
MSDSTLRGTLNSLQAQISALQSRVVLLESVVKPVSVEVKVVAAEQDSARITREITAAVRRVIRMEGKS